MSFWTTNKQSKKRDYVVMKHALKGVNYNIGGTRFRDGFAVVEKGSKTYLALKKIPMLRNSPEYPLSYLIKLKFITRSTDIKMIWGQDVYLSFLNSLKQEKEKEQLVEQVKELEVQKVVEETKTAEHMSNKCSKILESDKLCGNDKFDLSPSGYCKQHLLFDPILPDLGIVIPEKVFGKDNRKKLRKNVIKQLVELKKKAKQVEEIVVESTVVQEEVTNSNME